MVTLSILKPAVFVILTATITTTFAPTLAQAEQSELQSSHKTLGKTRADALGRRVEWRQLGFAPDFFADWENLNASGDLATESKKEAGFNHNDTIVVALKNWEQIDEFPHSDAFGIKPSEIRSLPADDLIHVRKQRLVRKSDNKEFPYIIAFFNMKALERFKAECRPSYVYEFVRLVDSERDIMTLVFGQNSFTQCQYG